MNEQPVLYESLGTHFPSKFRGVHGRIKLTRNSIVFYRISPLFMLFGLIGALLARSSKGKPTLSIKLANIRSFERQRQGLTTKVLCFKLANGTEHRLKIEKFNPFLAQLTNRLSSVRELRDLGGNRWAVVQKKTRR